MARGQWRSSRRGFLGLAVGAVATAACKADPAPAEPAEPADLVIVGGTVFTAHDKGRWVEAVAIKDGRFQVVGSREKVEAVRGSKTQVLDLGGGLATPGLTDAHGHVVNLGLSLETVDLRGAASVEEVIARLEKGAPESGWIIGRGWDQNLWPGKAMPTHAALSEAFPDRPVWLKRVDGHAGWANDKAMRLGSLSAESAAPEGGELLRDEEGQLTGVLVDTAMDLIPEPQPTKEEIRRRILAAQAHLLARGITGVHCMGVTRDGDAVYRELAQSGELKLRITAYAEHRWFDKEVLATDPVPAEPGDRYVLSGVKVYADGALGSRGAAMLQPYSDRPGHRGKMQHANEVFDQLAEACMGKGWQVATHAIGDRGNRITLDAYGLAHQRYRTTDHRFRVEHAQILHLDDIPRFSQMGVIASMQPTHATSDMPWVPDRIGDERLAGAYPWRRLLDAGVHLALGSDFPVEQADITHGIHAAMTRQDAEGRPPGGWLPDQKLTLEEALIGFTAEAAYAAKREEHLGKVAVGYQADLTLFEKDLRELEPAQIRAAKVTGTIIAGERMG